MSDATQSVDADAHRAGFVAIIGRPNVGKSTLLNGLIGQKVSIVSSKAQTTRHRVTGILTTEDAQLVFVDTPGFQLRHQSALNRSMNRTVTQVLKEVDVVLLMIEAERFGDDDRKVVGLLPEGARVVLAINKIDRMRDRTRLLPFIDSVRTAYPFADIVPVSATRGVQTDVLVAALKPHLPVSLRLFDEDDITDRSERFLAAEFLREKLFRLLGDELPYGLAVEIEQYETEGALRRIHAAVIVDKTAHKAMVIGRGGERLKRISTEARQEIERNFGGKVFLKVWVKVRSGWADDERALKSLGYDPS